jgi:hypothetical protein
VIEAFGVVVALAAAGAAGLLLGLLSRRLARRLGADPDAPGEPDGGRAPDERT